MSNVIPIVSSSPPPLEDDAGFGWDDDNDDDDFGNFASAPTISTTKDSSGSAFEVDWSSSEASLPGGGVAGQDAPKENGKSAGGNESVPADSTPKDAQPTAPSPPSVPPTNSSAKDEEVINGEDDFEDFAQFNDTDTSDTNEQSANDRSETKPAVNESSPSANNDATVIVTENNTVTNDDDEDDFQDFAQFSDTKSSLPQSETSETHQEQTESDRDHQPSDSSHSMSQSSNSEQCCDDSAADSDTAHSAVVKNNESVYSNASTTDSGVFSTDLSPLSHQSDIPESCASTEAEEESKSVHDEIVTEQSNIPTADPSTTDNFNNENDSTSLSTSPCEESVEDLSPAKEEAANVSTEHKVDSDLSSHQNLVPDSRVDETIEGNVAEGDFATGGVPHEELKVEKDDSTANADSVTTTESNEDLKHSKLVQESENLSHSNASDQDINGSSVSESLSNEEEKIVAESGGDSKLPGDDNNVDGSSDNAAEFKASEAQDEGDWGDFDSAGSEAKDVIDNEKQLANSDGEECNNIESTTENITSDEGKSVQSDVVNEFKDSASDGASGVVMGDDRSESDDKLSSEAINASGSTAATESEVSQHNEQKLDSSAASELNDVPKTTDEEDDKEFGDFNISRDRKESDPSKEVAPITFRTSICEEEADDDEDEDFSFGREKPPAFDDGDDDDGNKSDEFGAFGSANKGGLSENENDDFGDFDSAENFKSSDSQSQPWKASDNDGDDDFGDFGSSEQTAEGDAGWADFEAPAPPEESSAVSGSQSQSTATPVESIQNKTQKVQRAVISSFPEISTSDQVPVDEEEHEKSTSNELSKDRGLTPLQNDESLAPLDSVVELGLSNTLEAKQQTWTVVQHPAKKDPKVRLWSHLKDVDSSHALMYGWPASCCSKEVFSTLHIDTQNVLFTQKKQAVPFFAAGLSILEPIRGSGGGGCGGGGGSGGGGSVDAKKEKRALPAMQPTLLDTSKPEAQHTSTAQDIPPVDFDWSVSGLTNPLTANTLDLDFLVVQGSDSYEKTSVFKADNQDSTRPALQPLEEILKKSTPTAKLATHEVLSPEALRILEKMPDFSFMQSRVLMFPVKQ